MYQSSCSSFSWLVWMGWLLPTLTVFTKWVHASVNVSHVHKQVNQRRSIVPAARAHAQAHLSASWSCSSEVSKGCAKLPNQIITAVSIPVVASDLERGEETVQRDGGEKEREHSTPPSHFKFVITIVLQLLNHILGVGVGENDPYVGYYIPYPYLSVGVTVAKDLRVDIEWWPAWIQSILDNLTDRETIK